MFRMTLNVLRNLFTPKATRLYPARVREPFAGYRGQLEIHIEDCIFCGLCARKCPALCIAVDIKTGKWECDPFACVYCGICADHCPTDALFFADRHRAPAEKHSLMSYTGQPPKKKEKSVAATAGSEAPANRKSAPAD
ncbi:MAG: 4Fe-4S binding protein [Planctomycetes bacterium]|nr:4Fe-4S binding protein [Planctomycetota bacterium]